MKTLAYEENTIELFRFLKRHMPERLFSDEHLQVVFDYKDFQITAIREDFIVASQNNSDEIIRAKFERIDSAYQPNEYDKLLFQNNSINRLWTLQYFGQFLSY